MGFANGGKSKAKFIAGKKTKGAIFEG